MALFSDSWIGRNLFLQVERRSRELYKTKDFHSQREQEQGSQIGLNVAGLCRDGGVCQGNDQASAD